MNDLPESFGSVVKLLAEEKSVFSTICNPLLSAEIIISLKLLNRHVCGKRFLTKIQLTSRVIYFQTKYTIQQSILMILQWHTLIVKIILQYRYGKVKVNNNFLQHIKEKL